MVDYITVNPATQARRQADDERRRQEDAQRAQDRANRETFAFKSQVGQDAAIRKGLGDFYAQDGGGQSQAPQAAAPAAAQPQAQPNRPRTMEVSMGGGPTPHATPGFNPQPQERRNPSESIIRNLSQVPGGGTAALQMHTAQEGSRADSEAAFKKDLNDAFTKNDPGRVQALFAMRGKPVPPWATDMQAGMAFMKGLEYAESQGVKDPRQAGRVAIGYMQAMGIQPGQNRTQAVNAMPEAAPAYKGTMNTQGGVVAINQGPGGAVTASPVMMNGQPLQPEASGPTEFQIRQAVQKAVMATYKEALQPPTQEDIEQTRQYWDAYYRNGGQNVAPAPAPGGTVPVTDVTEMTPDARFAFGSNLPVGGQVLIEGRTYQKIGADQWQEVGAVQGNPMTPEEQRAHINQRN